MVCYAAVLFFVCPFSSPIIHCNTATLPITHYVPLDELIGTQDLTRPEAGIAPEFCNLVEARENAGGDTLPFRITRPHQQKPAGGFKVLDQCPDTLDVVRGNQSLLRKHV